MSNIKNYLRILFLISLFSFLSASQIVTNLWNMEFIGRPHSVKFVNAKDILLSSTRGVISRLEGESGDILWKKNMLYRSELEVESIGHYSLLVNKATNSFDLINNESSQLLLSAAFAHKKEDKLLKWELVNEQKNFVGMMVESRNIKIFNKERIVSDILAKDNEEFLDYFVDPEKELLHFVSLTDNKLEVQEVNLHKTAAKTNKKIASVDISSLGKIKHVFITKSFCLFISNTGEYVIFNIKQSSNLLNGKLSFSLENIIIEKFNFAESITFQSQNGMTILSLGDNSLQSIKDTELTDNIFFNKVDSNKHSLLFFLKKKNANSYALYNVDLSKKSNGDLELNQLSKHTINEELTIKHFLMNPFDLNTFLITSHEDALYLLDKSTPTPVNKIDQALSNLRFIELVGYYNEQGKQNEKIHYHNSINNIMEQKELFSIFTNIVQGISTDLAEIGMRLKNNILDLIENKSSTPGLNQKTKHYLIMFTEGSDELFIVNASNGLIVTHRQFKNKSVQKVIRNTNEDINKNENKYVYIIMKEETADGFMSLKFDMETTELNEDASFINELHLEEEIKSQCETLVADISKSPVSLSGYFHKSILDKYDNKISVEKNDKNIYGIKFKKSNNKLDFSVAWNLALNPYAIIQDKTPNIHSNVITTYHVTGKVFYKYIDSNILLVLSNIDDRTLLVSLIRATNGKILHQSYIQNVDFTQKIFSVFEENLVVISYAKKERTVSRNEVYSIEIMKREIEHSFISLLEKIFKFNLWGDSDIKADDQAETLQETDLVFLTQTYVLGRKIKGLFTSKTHLNIANKFLIFLFENNQVFLLDKRMISPRRPLVIEEKGKPTPVFDPLNSPYVDPELAAYNPVIALDYKQMLNMNFIDDQIDDVMVVPTQYESTFLVCTEGLNLSCYNVYPDKTFDTLNMSFAYSVIALFVAGIIILTYLLRRYVKKNELTTKFLSS